jgi:hypothetical protein
MELGRDHGASRNVARQMSRRLARRTSLVLGLALVATLASSGKAGWRSVQLTVSRAEGPALLSGLALSADERYAFAVTGGPAARHEGHVLDIERLSCTARFDLPLVSAANDAVWGRLVLAVAGELDPQERGLSVLLFKNGEVARPGPRRSVAHVTVTADALAAAGFAPGIGGRLALSPDGEWIGMTAAQTLRRQGARGETSVALIAARSARAQATPVVGAERCPAASFFSADGLDVLCEAPHAVWQWHVVRLAGGLWQDAEARTLAMKETNEPSGVARAAAGSLWIWGRQGDRGFVAFLRAGSAGAAALTATCDWPIDRLQPLGNDEALALSAVGGLVRARAVASGLELQPEAAAPVVLPSTDLDRFGPLALFARGALSSTGAAAIVGRHGGQRPTVFAHR